VTQTLQSITFGRYADKILELANETFAPLYRKVFQRYWHDGSFYAKMNQNYTTTDWQNCTFETYIPTTDQTHGLNYYRIAIQLLPEVNSQIFHEAAQKLRVPTRLPPGQLDSELQIIISPRLNKWGFIRSFNHTPNKTKGYQTNIYITNRREKASKTSMGGNLIVTPPEVLWVKITRAIAKFLDIRITAFLKAMKIQPFQIDYKDNNTLYYTYIVSAVLSPFSHSLRTTINSLSHTLDVLLHKIWKLKDNIGSQTLAKQAIHPLKDLNPVKLQEVFVYIRQGLLENLERTTNTLNPLEAAVLYGGKRNG
jgi:hypothetical protein